MLHHYPEPALGPVPQRMSFLVWSRGWAADPPQNWLIDRVVQHLSLETNGFGARYYL
jgi:hypothetical protein